MHPFLMAIILIFMTSIKSFIWWRDFCSSNMKITKIIDHRKHDHYKSLQNVICYKHIKNLMMSTNNLIAMLCQPIVPKICPQNLVYKQFFMQKVEMCPGSLYNRFGWKNLHISQNLSNHNNYVYFKFLSNYVDYDTQNVFMYYF